MTIFSPDGKYGYVCSSFSPETVVIATAEHKIVGQVKQESPFCPDIAATPDGRQVWLTLKDVGKVMVFNARPPFDVVKVIETGPITNHVNFARNANGQFAYVTVGGLNAVKVFKTDTFEQVATIPTGPLPHGLWPSGDGNRIYVGLENADAAAVIDTLENKVVATIPLGQAPQGSRSAPLQNPFSSCWPLRTESQQRRSHCSTKVSCKSCRLRSPGCRPSSLSSWRFPKIRMVAAI
jgi:YVTN family beta-propeller protein